MSIRSKQLLLLLCIALIPTALSAWHSVYQIDSITGEVASATRTKLLGRERRYMQEKVADIGRALNLTARATTSQLRQQQLMFESALGREPQQQRAIMLCEEVPDSPTAVAETRFSRESDGGFSSPFVKVSYEQPGFLLTPAAEQEPESQREVQQLASVAEDLKHIYREASAYSLWHYVALENGISMVYPGHGEYPALFDPRERPWYRQTMSHGDVTWLPLTIDASTGQPILTVATPIRSPHGEAVGVTAIDLPLRQLLSFQSSTKPWLNAARLALLAEQDGQISIVATQEPLELDSNWDTPPQHQAMSQLAGADVSRILALDGGETILLEQVEFGQQSYMMAITALRGERGSWLALASPYSAIEQAVSEALSMLDVQRSSTLRQHLWAAVILALVVILVALIAAHRFTAALISMSQTTEALAAGDLQRRTGLKRSDEVGLLSSSIDHMADSIADLQQQQEKAYREMLVTLTRALEKKDSYTAAHSGRVTRYSMMLGRRIGLDDKTLEILRFGALTHDLGKIGIADNVLNKPAALNAAETEIMRQHPAYSKSIMKPLVRFREYAEIAGSHHENWDGSGYPDGLSGDNIPLLARVVAIADAWDAMTGDRVYRKGMPALTAIRILDAEKDDGQFDPHLIREFLAMLREDLAMETPADQGEAP